MVTKSTGDHMGTSGPRGPYAKTAKVRASIMKSAAEIFTEVGYHATNMLQVADRAGISRRGLVHHFPTKEDLLMAILGAYDEESAVNIPSEPGIASIDAMVMIARDNKRRGGLLELQTILIAENVSLDHPGHESFRRRYEYFRNYLTASFERLAADGELHSPFPPSALATMFIALQEGLETQYLYDGGIDPEPLLVAFLQAALPDWQPPPGDMTLNALAP